MIVLDTNVLSELMRPVPASQVLAWVDAQAPAELCVTTLTVAEILTGVGLLPRGKRRDGLEAAATRMFERDFAGRCHPFDRHAATHYAEIVTGRTRAGAPISTIDAQIAAIARSRDASLATRDVGDFRDCGLVVVDPWAS